MELTSPLPVSSSYICGHSDWSRLSASSSAGFGEGSFGSALQLGHWLLLGFSSEKNLPAVEELNLVAPWYAIHYYAMRVPSTCVVPENCLMRPTTVQTKSNSQMASKQSHDKRIWKIFILCIFFEINEKSNLPYTLVFSWLTKVSWKTTSRLWNYPRTPFEQKKTC